MPVTEDATITSKGQVTIPKRIRDRLELEEGTEVEFVLGDDGGLEIRPKRPAMERLRDVQKTLSRHDVDLEKMRRESKATWSSHDRREEQS
ncbi:AbrB/MazE/SpoVT family DNA-binding domain-containing protein [Natrinema amylolyticum]|uniref:AbrB/MazE/SpoVT family DNA-binding domain-containing protein n=1 Tax=Natrinema amylolyticum TaxID=2878679 RepID=UPI001CFA5A05|nr:AbrB/MazE/SpoVT family DNA-binding domain-containing protein [Natrinema amylolyticum]